jgi:hypothetical protein
MVINVAPSTSVISEVNAPPWAQRTVNRLLAWGQPINPIQPVRAWAVQAKTDLPPPAEWPGSIVWIVGLSTAVLSVGGSWQKFTLAGPI